MEKLLKDTVEQSVRASLDEPIKELKGIIEDLKKQLEAEKDTNKSQAGHQ